MTQYVAFRIICKVGIDNISIYQLCLRFACVLVCMKICETATNHLILVFRACVPA